MFLIRQSNHSGVLSDSELFGEVVQDGYMLGYYCWLVVWNPLFLDPSDGVFSRFYLAVLLRLPHLMCLFVLRTELAH